MNEAIGKKIDELSRDPQEAGMIKQAIEKDNRPRCRFCNQPMVEDDGFYRCERHKLAISKRLI